MDAMVKHIVSQVRKGHMKPEGGKTAHPMVFPVVTYKNNRVFDDIQNSLYSLISDKKAMVCWIEEKQRCPEEAIPKISWDCLEDSMKKANEGTKIFICKWTTGCCGTGKT